jgi:lysyl-tRNA synthetase class 2
LRQFFADQGVLETETPVIVAGTATDPHVESLRVRGAGIDAYLHTSPEHAMKRLLASGYPDIFQVCKVFRDGESGSCHRPEFTMVEWYRRGFGLQDIVADTLRLLDAMLEVRILSRPETTSYRDAFLAATGIDPLAAGSGEIAEFLGADDSLRASLGTDRNAWLDLLMATRVAPGLPADRLTAICHYPADQAALARVCPDDPMVADRFELFLGPLELANGFVELTDADEQSERFEADRELRRSRGLHVPDADAALIDAVRNGLPDCAGVALGLDRVLMIEQGLDDIGATLTFDPGT